MARSIAPYLPSAMARPKEGTTFIHAAPRHGSIQATTAGLSAAYGPSRPGGLQQPQLVPVHLAQSTLAAQAAATLMAPRRTRQPIACDPCRASKRKCSGGLPCDSCLRRGPSIVCHYDAASQLKVRTRAEMRGRTRGRRGKHMSFRSSAPSLKDSLHLRGSRGTHHGTMAHPPYDHRSDLQAQQGDGFSHMYSTAPTERKGMPTSTYWSASHQDSHHPHAQSHDGGSRTAMQTMSYAPRSQRTGMRSPHHPGHHDLDMETSGTPESTRSDSESISTCADDGDIDDDDDDDDDEYMQTSPLFRGMVLDRVQLRRQDVGKQDMPERGDSRYEQLSARVLPSIDSLLNVSHTRTSARRPTRTEPDEELVPSKVEPTVEPARRFSSGAVNSAPPTPTSEHRLQRGTVFVPANAHSTPGSVNSGFTSLPQPHGTDVSGHSPGPAPHGHAHGSQHTGRLGWSVNKTAPALPPPRDMYRARSCLSGCESANDPPTMYGQYSEHFARPPHQYEAQQESCPLPEWVKPLPASRLARGHAQRPLLPPTSAYSAGEEGRAEPQRYSRHDTADTGQGCEDNVYNMYREDHRYRTEGAPSLHPDSAQVHMDPSRPRYLEERRLSSEHRVPVSQRRF